MDNDPPLVFSLASHDWGKARREAEAEFPDALYGEPWDATRSALKEVQNALSQGTEEVIQQALTMHPYAIQYAIAHSGHHGTWVFPKQMIKQRGADGSAGLIPDFLVATRSSLGYFWHIVELKRPDVQFSNESGTAMTTAANKAIAQCNRYLEHFQNYIDAGRTSVRVPELVQVSGAVLIMGDSANENSQQRQLRAEYVRNSASIDVVSYRRILDGLRREDSARE